MDLEPEFDRQSIKVLQINVGKICNMSCTHCHVEAGPHRKETMSRLVYQRVIDLMDIFQMIFHK